MEKFNLIQYLLMINNLIHFIFRILCHSSLSFFNFSLISLAIELEYVMAEFEAVL